MKFDDLSPAAESSPVSLQKLDRRKSQQFGCDLDVISVSLSYNGKERKEKEKSNDPPIWIPDEKTSSCMRCGRSFCVASTETSLSYLDVYLDDVFVRLALDWLVLLIIHSQVELISVFSPLIIFYCRHFHFGF